MSAPPVDPQLLLAVYTSTFRPRDGSTLAGVGAAALETMRGGLQRLVSDSTSELLPATRALPDDRLLGLLLLAVAGNFVVDRGASALPQECGVVVDGGTGALVLRNGSAAQSVILEVLLIVSIVFLLRAWAGRWGRGSAYLSSLGLTTLDGLSPRGWASSRMYQV